MNSREYLPLITTEEHTATVKNVPLINNLWSLLIFRHFLTGLVSSMSRIIQPRLINVIQKRSGNL